MLEVKKTNRRVTMGKQTELNVKGHGRLMKALRSRVTEEFPSQSEGPVGSRGLDVLSGAGPAPEVLESVGLRAVDVLKVKRERGRWATC